MFIHSNNVLTATELMIEEIRLSALCMQLDSILV